MARITKCDQVFFRVVPKQAPRLDVVNLEILQRPASLTAPAVAVQDSLAECGVQSRVEAQPGSSLPNSNRRIPLYPSRILLLSLIARPEPVRATTLHIRGFDLAAIALPPGIPQYP